MVELASDFLDRSTPIFRDDVCFFISQSGMYFNPSTQFCFPIFSYGDIEHIFFRCQDQVMHIIICITVLLLSSSLSIKYRCIPFFSRRDCRHSECITLLQGQRSTHCGRYKYWYFNFTIKKPSPLQVLYEPSKAYGACACLDLERNALFTLLGHEAPACSYASYPCCLCHYSLSQSPQARPTGLYCVIRIAQSAHPFFMQCILRFNL